MAGAVLGIAGVIGIRTVAVLGCFGIVGVNSCFQSVLTGSFCVTAFLSTTSTPSAPVPLWSFVRFLVRGVPGLVGRCSTVLGNLKL